MKTKSSNKPSCELSIRGDELEHDRIQLENNLLHTDLSLHLSSGVDDYHGSVEYPRHNAGPSPFADFASFENPSRDNFDPDNHSHWSYRTMDDEEGINPYAGETISTAAHHASALTLSAGLTGRRVRRDVSLSGAEYDPDRPLHDMIAGVDSKLSVFDIGPPQSKYAGSATSVAFDPLVVDSSTELDRVLQSGLATLPGSHSVPLRSADFSANSSASDSESSNHAASRPKISDALRRVSFSPKRPHSTQSHYSSHPGHPQSHTQLHAQNKNVDTHNLPPLSTSRAHSSPLAHHQADNAPTPKPRSRRNVFPSSASTQPEVRLQPPTPSSAGSQFTKMARGLALEIEANIANQHAEPVRQSGTRRVIIKSPRGKVHLPDVTGLTSAVESPAKPMSNHYMYRAEEGPRETEARLLSTLTAVQSKLKHLESENSISRRRVRELEIELEACKREVARERTRVTEKEEIIVRQQRDVDSTSATRKGKSRVLDADEQMMGRYTEVVEEKKALEALIATLRAHLTRLTAELSSHQNLLTELRSLREADSRALKEKSLEVDKLREEVERLGGEVEVLRGVVEEGLKERRLVREQHSQSHVSGEDVVHDDIDPRETEVSNEGTRQNDPEALESEDENGREPLSPRLVSPRLVSTSQWNGAHPDRTDCATLGTTTQRFIDSAALERISAEVEERRSDHSGSILSQPRSERISHSRSRSRSRPLSCSPSPELQGSLSGHAIPVGPRATIETPFPQIRGSHLERLFFSAPEHNAKTCTVCHRRRPSNFAQEQTTFWSTGEKHKNGARAENAPVDDDEGFVEGSETGEHERPTAKSRGKQRERMDFAADPSSWKTRAEKGILPPQTVLARVLRELEDDFTHYKSIYVELADQYKTMDAVSDVPKRNVLAQHLREVIDILEQKGDQIASLYELLTFKDKPISDSVVPPKQQVRPIQVSDPFRVREKNRKNP